MAPLELISLLVAIAALFGWVSSRWLKLPITIGTMLLTVVLSVALAGSASQYAPGLHTWALKLVQQINFESLILHGMLPLLLFAGAFLLDLEFLAREKLIVTLLSLAGTVLSAGLTAALMFLGLWVLRIPTNWLACLFFGALISPTDPIAVLEMLRRVGVPKNIQANWPVSRSSTMALARSCFSRFCRLRVGKRRLSGRWRFRCCSRPAAAFCWELWRLGPLPK